MGFAVSVGRGIEEDASPREILRVDEVGYREVGTGRVCAEDVRQVADPHVVGDDGEVVPPESLPCGGEVADGARKSLLGIEPCVDRPPAFTQTLGLGHISASDGTGDPHRQPPALVQIDVHSEEALPGLRQDLRQARRCDRIVPGDDVRTSTALEEHDRLDEIRLEAAVVHRVLDQRSEGVGALGCREDTARALRIERVAEPECCGVLELLGLRIVVCERVQRCPLHPWQEDASRVVVTEEPNRQEHDRRENGHRSGSGDDSTTANDHS